MTVEAERPGAVSRPAQRRSAGEIIDATILENRLAERLLYSFAALFVLTGCSAIIWGIIYQLQIVAIIGAAQGALFIPAMYYTRSIRRENLLIRLLEVPLNNSHTSKEAADAIREMFLTVWDKGQPK